MLGSSGTIHLYLLLVPALKHDREETKVIENADERVTMKETESINFREWGRRKVSEKVKGGSGWSEGREEEEVGR